jgi:hypothetical protein
VDVCRFVEAGWDEAVTPPVFTEGRRKRERIQKAISERIDANRRAEASLGEEEKRNLEHELATRPLPPGHGRLPLPEKLWVIVKWGTAYLTIPRDSRRAIRALAFPSLRGEDRRPIRLTTVGDG